MARETTQVLLVTPQGKERAFAIDHAERLLALGDAANGGWRIKPGSKYYYSEKDGIRVKRDTEFPGKAPEGPAADEGVGASEEAALPHRDQSEQR